MRITVVNQFYAPDISPTAQLAASLAEHRAAAGDTVTVITGRSGYLEGISPTGRVATGPGLRVRRVWTPRVGRATPLRRVTGYITFLLGATVRLATLARQDVVITMTTPPYVVVTALVHRVLRRGRPSVVLWSMDCYPDAAERFGAIPAGGLVARLLRAVNRRVMARIDHVVALDGAMADLLAAYRVAPGRPPITVVPNWERATQFPAGGPPASWSGYDGLGIDLEERGVVVYLGNAGVGHRFDTVLDAAGRLADEAVFVFIGGGARWDELAEQIRRRGLTNVVQHPYVPKDETPSVMAGADAALITLDDRALGVMSPSKLHANLAAGLPVLYVGPAGSNVDEAITAFGCGVSVRNGDADGVVDAIRALRAEPGAAATMRKRARAAFDEAYCDERALPRLDAILDDLAPR